MAAAQERFDLVIRAKDEASVVLDRINTKVLFLADGTVHKFDAVAKATDVASAGFRRMDLRAAALGANLSGLPPILNQVVSSLAFGNAAVAAVSVGIGLLANELLSSGGALNKYIGGVDQATKTIREHRDALDELAASTSSYAEKALALIGIGDRAAEKELARAKVELSMAENGKRAATLMDRLGGSMAWVSLNADDQAEAVAALTVKIAELSKELGITAQQGVTFGPYFDQNMVDWAERIKTETAKAKEEMRQLVAANDEWNRSLQNQGQRDWLQGPRSEAEQKAFEAQNLRDAFGNAGPQSWQIDQDDAMRRQKEALDASAQNFQDFANMIHGSMSNAADQLVGIMFGVRTSFAEIFKGMAQDFSSFFISTILQSFAQKAATSFLSLIPGVGPILGIAASGKMSAGASGVDISSAGAARFPNQGYARKANVNITIQGDIIGDQEYVTRKIIPAIESAVAYGQSKLAVR